MANILYFLFFLLPYLVALIAVILLKAIGRMIAFLWLMFRDRFKLR